MEVKQSEVTQENWDEWNNLKLTQVCAECGGDLDVRTVPERESLVFGCPAHPDAGYRQRTSYTEDYRRGDAVPLVIKDNIEAKMMVKTELNRAINLLAMRYPTAIKDPAGAALFIRDCMRLGLDPLIHPAEAVPIAFKTRDKAGHEKWTVAMIITEDGYLSMAARGCPEEYDGAPETMPLLNYLVRENPERPLEELEKLAKRTAKDLSNDEEAWVWVALGRRRSAATVNPVYGYFTQADYADAKASKLPAAKQPGNQARVRAVKHWVRETFPECRQKMLDYTAEIMHRSAGAIEAQRWIDAEYRILIDTSDEKTPLPSPPGGQKAVGAAKSARSSRAKRAENKVGESAERSTGPAAGQGGKKHTAAPSGADETTLLLDRPSPEMATPREAPAADHGARINPDWLKECLTALKWSEGTTRSWIAFKFPGVNTDGSLTEVLGRLTYQQGDAFTKELQAEVDKIQPKLM